MAATDHRETRGRREIAGPIKFRDRLLARIDQVGVEFLLGRERPHAEHAVLGLQRDVAVVRHIVRNKRRDTDPEIDVEAVLKFPGGPFGHLVAIPWHRLIPPSGSTRRALFNAFFVRTLDDPLHIDPRCVDRHLVERADGY